jgi:hypothetical protein
MQRRPHAEDRPLPWFDGRVEAAAEVYTSLFPSTPALFDIVLDPDPRAVERVTNAFMEMRKLELAALEEAYRGGSAATEASAGPASRSLPRISSRARTWASTRCATATGTSPAATSAAVGWTSASSKSRMRSGEGRGTEECEPCPQTEVSTRSAVAHAHRGRRTCCLLDRARSSSRRGPLVPSRRADRGDPPRPGATPP